MNSVINSYYVAKFFCNIFDVPDYYVFYGTCNSCDADAVLGAIGDIKILLINTLEFKPDKIVNDIIRVTDFNEYYDLLIPLDFYNTLILNDTIKSLGGEIYEKNAL